jgi:hypothetical protein
MGVRDLSQTWISTIPTARLMDVADAAAAYVVRSPMHHRDEAWDLVFMKLEYGGQEIELGGAEGAKYFDRAAECWCSVEIEFGVSVECTILNVRVPIMPFEQLVAYKRRLGRDVDQQDLDEIGSGSWPTRDCGCAG